MPDWRAASFEEVLPLLQEGHLLTRKPVHCEWFIEGQGQACIGVVWGGRVATFKGIYVQPGARGQGLAAEAAVVAFRCAERAIYIKGYCWDEFITCFWERRSFQRVKVFKNGIILIEKREQWATS